MQILLWFAKKQLCIVLDPVHHWFFGNETVKVERIVGVKCVCEVLLSHSMDERNCVEIRPIRMQKTRICTHSAQKPFEAVKELELTLEPLPNMIVCVRACHPKAVNRTVPHGVFFAYIEHPPVLASPAFRSSIGCLVIQGVRAFSFV
ncbi:hypothetical protein RUM43_001749 [Polyplax serrata]|uniref:Uncharacterized protein n=1 Tax=Polyplax serrata TaxID=468196 RepID=A0AAN8SIH4_POLSC